MTRYLLLAATAAVALTNPAPAADPAAKAVTVGMVQGMFRDVQPALVQALSRPFRDLMYRQAGVTGDIAIHTDAFALADEMKVGKCQLGVFHGFEFAWAKQRCPDLCPLVVTVPPGRKVQALVVVHKDRAGDSLAALNADPVAVPRGTKAHCLAFFDRLKANLNGPAPEAKAQPTLTAEEALNAVAACESCACLVDAAAFAGYQALQPGAYKHLRVLCASENFPQSVIAYRKGTFDEATAARLRDGLTGAHKTAAGKPLMMLWNLKGFEEPPADYDAQLAEIGKAYPAPVRLTSGGK